MTRRHIPQTPRPETDDFTPRVTSPYLMGLYLAVNAIPDAVLALDGPRCFPLKTPAIQGNHDWFSTLSGVGGPQRCLTTRTSPATVMFPRDEMLAGIIRSASVLPTTAAVFVSARPMAALTGTDYERLCREAAADKPVFFVPPKSLRSTWLGGYAEALKSLAAGLDLGKPAPRKDRVAVVGYLWDRSEGDHKGNIAELRRALRALGLGLESVWLCGEGMDSLRAASRASAVISLPYGREAASILGRRLKVPVVETCLPFGFSAAERFLTDLGKAFGRERQARRFIDAELARAVPALEWVTPFVFQNAQIGFIGDPQQFEGFCSILDLLGARLAFAFLTGEPSGKPPARPHVYYDPTQKRVVSFIKEQAAQRGLDLIVSANVGTKLGKHPIMEFGFPSYYTHALVDRPFLGFQGCVGFVGAMADTIRHMQLY